MSWGCAVSFLILMECCLNFFMNILNIEKNKIVRILFPIFHVFFAFYAISNIKKNQMVNKIIKFLGGGGGCRQTKNIFFRKPILSHFSGNLYGRGMLFLHFMLFPTFLETINSGNKKVFFVFFYARSISNIFLEILKSAHSRTG